MSEEREDFCPLCLTVPLAFAGIGSTAYGSKKDYQKKRKKYFILGLILVFISLAIAAYYLFFKKDCSDCA